MKNPTAFFENIEKVCYDHAAKVRAHDEKKQAIIDTFGWDSPEMKDWYMYKETLQNPFSSGVMKAYRAWKDMICRNEEELVLGDFLWDREVADFVNALRLAGIVTFIYTNRGTSVMDNLHDLADNGCQMVGLCTISRIENRWGEEEEELVPGIRFFVGE